MLPTSDVEMAFEMLLGRRPLDEQVVLNLSRQCSSIAELGAALISSAEFRRKMHDMTRIPRGDMEIELDVTPESLHALVSRVERQWRRLGETEPHWSVLARPEFKSSRISENKDAFFRSGQPDLNTFIQILERNELDTSRFTSVLELGCGLGRVTNWLARTFPNVLALDISSTHLQLAEHHLAGAHPNVRFIKLTHLDDLQTLPSFDLFYSLIVLQHNPPPIIRAMLTRVLSSLSPGGIGYFQVPTYGVGYRFCLDTYLARTPQTAGIEMHVIPQKELFELINESGCTLIEISEDGRGWPRFISNTLLVSKASAKNEES